MAAKAESAAKRERRGAPNPKRTQDARDRVAFLRFIRKFPREAEELMKTALREMREKP